jgi:quercetin dioxygenase-like cupin family protein
MKIVQGDQVEWKRGLQHRGGTFHYRHLLDGTPGTPGNFQFNLGQLDGDFVSPRHRHNFEQFRYLIEGTMSFGRNGKMTTGSFGYFPEGAAYGPQTSAGRTLTAVLQFGGASGSGYLSRKEVQQGTEALKAFGEFKDGIFRRNQGVPGRKNTDAYQAIWEHMHNQIMAYPKPRYRDPILLDPEHYEWSGLRDERGVSQKSLGTFTERQCGATLLRLEQGASHRMDGRSVILVLKGEGRVNDEAYRALTALHLEEGEQAAWAATADSEILHLMLPDLSGLQHGRHAALQAAE